MWSNSVVLFFSVCGGFCGGSEERFRAKQDPLRKEKHDLTWRTHDRNREEFSLHVNDLFLLELII